MTFKLADRWNLELDRGPDWLFARLGDDAVNDATGLANGLFGLLEKEFVHRLVVELEQIEVLRSELVGELVLLHKRIHENGGMMRICGLSNANQEVLRINRLDDRFPQYPTREDAVMGYRPEKPR